MTRPESLFEAASYDLNKFRERRMADRRFAVRDTPDRRKTRPVEGSVQHADNENKLDNKQDNADVNGSP